MMRFVDVMYAFPALLLIILMMAFFRSSFAKAAEPGTVQVHDERAGHAGRRDAVIFIGIGITSWEGMARLAPRAGAEPARERVCGGGASNGSGQRADHVRHILPNILGPLIVAETLAIPGYINYETF